MATNSELKKERSELPYTAEYAKSGRAGCKSCHLNIPQGALRMSVRTPSPFFDGLQDNWYHFRCFWPKIKRSEINEASIRGMDFLKWEDQEEIRAKITEKNKECGIEDSSAPKVRVEYAKTARGKCAECKNSIEKDVVKLGMKNSYFHVDCFRKIHESAITNLEKIEGFKELDDADKEILKKTFGNSIEKSKKRKQNSSNVMSPRKLLKEEKKTVDIDDAKRKLLQSQAEKIWNVRKCLEDNVNINGLKALLEANGQDPAKHNILEQVVDYVVFGCPEKCERCGGQVIFSMSQQTYRCTGYVTAYTKCTYNNKNPSRKKFVFPRDLLKEIKELSTIKTTEVRERIYNNTGEEIVKPKSLTFLSSRGKEKNDKKELQVMKDGAVVDPHCEVADCVHVWKDTEGSFWQATLGSADVATNKNSFYKLQLLKHDEKNKYYLFRSWGRVGTAIGGSKTESFGVEIEEAKNEFQRLFLEKSGNEWKGHSNFQKVPGKMCILETEFTNPETVLNGFDVKPGSLTKLHKSIQDVINMIFDVASMQHTLNEFEIDTEKMPLGKLSKRQIRSAYSVLSELQELMSHGDVTEEQYIDATNRFYTFVPHYFGRGQGPPILNSNKKIEEKTKMLDELMEIEIAYSILRTDDLDDKKRDPIDVHYEKLHVTMDVIEENKEEFKRIVEYVNNTHASTHNYYTLKVIDVIRLRREEEVERFKKDLSNRCLLWHGSRTTNYAGILSQGLRIAPKEAPVTGYMFGKGIYFADMVSKSANYCCVSKGQGLLLLCDVALGEIQEEKHAKYIRKLKAGKNSCKGIGKTIPDPKGAYITEDGVTVPMGKPMDTKKKDLSLLYNEYIVYDVTQVQLKYLVRVEFIPIF